MALTPVDYAKSNTEHAHQVAIFMALVPYFDQHPLLRLAFAIPNGGSRGNTRLDRMIRGANLKMEGVKAGVPDIMLPVARHGFLGLFVELKRIKSVGKAKGRVGDAQSPWIKSLSEQGYCVGTCYGYRSALDLISWYMEIKIDG